MEIVSENIDSANHNFLADSSACDDNFVKQRLNGNKKENVIYALNPLLSESLNNLVKRFDRTKIPKPPPSKGHSIRKKPKIHSSLPNIFLPSSFDDNLKCSNSEKKVQWTNKLDLDLDKMKSVLRENYNNWCKEKQRSRSIPTLARDNVDQEFPETSSQNVDFIFSRSKDENIMTIKFIKCDLKSTNETDNDEKSNSKSKSSATKDQDKQEQSRSDSNSHNIDVDTAESDDKQTFSAYMYLDGAIIEPISPATPPKSDTQELALHSSDNKEELRTNPNQSTDTQIENSPIPTSKNKRGRKPRKKKAQSTVTKKIKAAIIDTCSKSKEETDIVESMDAPDLEPETNDPIDTANTDLPDDIEVIELVDSSQIDTKPTLKVSPDQTNDLEILSKSITNTVDTSMLPPRKRYKRLMYLENNKSASPREVTMLESVQKENSMIDIPDLEALDGEETKLDDSKPPAKSTTQRSRSKRKKKTVSSTKPTVEKKTATNESKLMKDDAKEPVEVMEVDNIISITPQMEIQSVSTISKPESLKRSKREAAARGFANMVAMSLNNSNSSQSQDNSFELKPNAPAKKPGSSRADSNDTSSETSAGKIFKRPRKSKNIDAGPSKSKVKRSSSPPSTVDCDKIASELKSYDEEPQKSRTTRKSKDVAVVEDNPPSPNETIISSSDSSHQDQIKYRKIRTNTYIDPKPLYWFQEVERCGCKPSKLRHIFDIPDTTTKSSGGTKPNKKRMGIVWDCGDNCLNRLTYTECQAKNCQCGDACANQKIRKAEWAPGLQVKDIVGKGKGVITTKPIREGTFIIEYVGEVINEATFQDRMVNLYRDDSHHYCLHLHGDMLIDAYRSGSMARFVNHSCQPNCEMQKWMVNGAYRMCLFATEDIPADAELYYDYNFCSFNTQNTQICLCRSAACRGFIGSKPRVEQTATQKDRRKLLYIFGRLLSGREKIFILRNTIFLLRNRELGRCQRLGIRKPLASRGANRLPSTISEIKRRKAKKNQFLTQMSALNSIRSIKTRLWQNAQDNEHVTRTAQLGQVLKDLYNTLLEQKDPLHPHQQLVAPFIHCLNRRKYPEFYRMVASTGVDTVASLTQVYERLLDGNYKTLLAFDQDMLHMLHNVELYAGRHSNIGQCAERIKPIYKELKMNSIALYEALTDEVFDEKDKQKLMSNNLQLVTNALAAIKSHHQAIDVDSAVESTPTGGAGGGQKNKKRKQSQPGAAVGARGRLERGAEVIKCICGFLIEAGHVMVQCDRCFVWQHAYCMNVARSSELADVTRMEPYYCHICLNIATESLIREIPRHFVISDETIGSNNTLFWTLLKSADNLFKIDDFVYIADGDSGTKSASPKSKQTNDSENRRIIMRIYSLWKDGNGQRWMEGGLFLRPYDNQLKSLLTDKDTGKTTVVGSNKRKSSSAIDLSTHKWHQSEVIYTDFTKILPLDSCLGRCVVLNSYTFRMGRPLLQNSNQNVPLDVFVCDWMINHHGEWSEIDPTYLKINTKPYCFERFQDGNNELSSGHERFSRQYLAEDLQSIDDGVQPIGPDLAINKSNTTVRNLSDEDKIAMKMRSLNTLLKKLVDFAYERNQNLPLSSTPSSISGSSNSSRGASPLCENSGAKSPLRPLFEVMSHGPRKSSTPRKFVKTDESSDTAAAKSCVQLESNEPNKEAPTIVSDASDSSPQLMIVVDEFQQTPKTDLNTGLDDLSKNTDKDSDEKDMEEKTVSSIRETVDDQSNLGSEINFGDFVNLLKNTDAESDLLKEKNPKSKHKTSKFATKRTKKSKKKVQTKKNEIKPVSEIRAGEDEYVPIGSSVKLSAGRPRTRSRKCATEPSNDESCSSNNNTEIELILTGSNIKGIFTGKNNDNLASESVVDEEIKLPTSCQQVVDPSNPSELGNTDDDGSTKTCFVKLERMKVKQKKERESAQSSLNTKNKNATSSLKGENVSQPKKKVTELLCVSLSEPSLELQSSATGPSKASIDETVTPQNCSKSQPNSSSSSDQSDLSKSEYSTNHSMSLSASQLIDKDDLKIGGTISTSNRSKRKKGVPKRIPFDFSYPTINTIKPTPLPSAGSSFDDEVVDLSAGRNFATDPVESQPETSTTTNDHSIETIATAAPVISVPESRHITAANDFSSIENISSN